MDRLKNRQKKERRDCENCIAYCNMLGGEENLCGLGFRVVEEAETDEMQQWHGYIRPYRDECETVCQPKTKEEFLAIALILGIKWDPDEVLIQEECNWL